MTSTPSASQATGQYGPGQGDSVPISWISRPRIGGMVEVLHHSTERFYELLEDGMSVGLFIYEQNPSRTSVTHAMVREDRRGLGLGKVLIGSALDHLGQSDANIVVYCDSVADFLKRNPAFKSRVNPTAVAHTPTNS